MACFCENELTALDFFRRRATQAVHTFLKFYLRTQITDIKLRKSGNPPELLSTASTQKRLKSVL